MIRIIEIAAEWLFSLIGLAFICWVTWYSLKKSDDPPKLIFKSVFSVAVILSEYFFAHHMVAQFQASINPADNLIPALVMVGSIVVCGITLGITWAPEISDLMISPLTSLFDGGKLPPEPKPFYSIAISKRKRSKSVEALALVREQLAKFPDDFEGIQLLAGIQAEDLNDLPAAETTFNEFCERENAPPRQVVAALTQLADWHMKFFQDLGAARVALQRIVQKYPDTEIALVAKQRIAHLDGTRQILVAAQHRRPVFVPEGVKNVGLLESSAHLAQAETAPSELAAAYVKQLGEYPDDTEAREKLAVVYATHYQRLDMATTKLQQLIEEPKHPPKRIAHWLNLLADLQIKCGADYDTVRATLEKIVERFPDFAVANQAQTRIAHLKLELKSQEKSQSKTLGEYEQNIGLKGN